MKPSSIPGVYSARGRFFTINPVSCKQISVYGEQIKTINEIEYRAWNPFRSKMASALMKGLATLTLTQTSTLLYLGAASGTTVSHFSDILNKGMIYAVEHSPVVAKDLVVLAEQRENIIPIYADANHPEIFETIVPKVDMVYQDISQRNQADIFTRNMNRFLKKDGQGIIMVKARSIDVSLKPKKAYEIVCNHLTDNDFNIQQVFALEPYEKDHAAILVSKK
ncbi:MAG: fibrillarin-like rRNA/tRNA 2'-O-methyltransferase [Candidatus Thermoplasmatota archaeon]|nr:fibrillarin-like rRNA/tRNA 2'-O-methyltransferase [Candidatus Thermoplasmatota archaeon]